MHYGGFEVSGVLWKGDKGNGEGRNDVISQKRSGKCNKRGKQMKQMRRKGKAQRRGKGD